MLEYGAEALGRSFGFAFCWRQNSIILHGEMEGDGTLETESFDSTEIKFPQYIILSWGLRKFLFPQYLKKATSTSNRLGHRGQPR